MKRAPVSLLALLAVGACASPPEPVDDTPPVVVFLVRHAERADDGTQDPPISPSGEARARLLATLLGDAGITAIHSTDLQRTRQTGAPLVSELGLEVQVYDPKDLPGFAARLAATPGRHLVLGHSNTTPDLVAALGGESGGPIDDLEYDRLYVVTLPRRGPVSTVLLRYGAAYAPEGSPSP